MIGIAFKFVEHIKNVIEYEISLVGIIPVLIISILTLLFIIITITRA